LVYPLPEGAPVPPELEMDIPRFKIYSTSSAFVALKADGSITAWGHSNLGGTTPASIDWIVPTKVVSYPMNGDISDVMPLGRLLFNTLSKLINSLLCTSP
jgi:hypothetical protein